MTALSPAGRRVTGLERTLDVVRELHARHADPTVAMIASYANLKPSSVRAWLSQLVQAGVIVTVNQYAAHGMPQVYRPA